jgi:hypothetical protein
MDSRENALSDYSDHLGCSKAISYVHFRATVASCKGQSDPQVSPPSRRGAPKKLAAHGYVHPREPIIEKSRWPNVSAWPFYRTCWLHCNDQNGPQMGYKSPLGVNRWAVPDGQDTSTCHVSSSGPVKKTQGGLGTLECSD